MATKVLGLFLVVVCASQCLMVTAQLVRRGTQRQASAAQTAAQRQFQQLQIALQLPPGTQIHQGSNPPPAQPGMVWIQVPAQGSYPPQGGYPPQTQQPGNYPAGGYPPQTQQPGNYPPQGSYPPQTQQPGNYPAGGYPPQQPGTYPGSNPPKPPPQVDGDTQQPATPAYPPPFYPAPVPPYPGNQPIRPDNGPDSDTETAPEPVDGVSEGGLSPGQETGGWEVPEGQAPVPPSPLLVHCRAPRGQFPSPTSCNTFINCWDDTVVEQQCPGGTVFNELGFCDYPENVDCSNRGGDGGAVSPVVEGMGEEGACPTPYGAYRSSTSCGIFYVCNAGTPNRFECPEGLNYNTNLGVCDYPYRVDCGGVSSERPVAPELPGPDVSETGEFDPDTSEQNKYYGGLKKIPANMVDSRVPCDFRLNPSCTSVSLRRNKRGIADIVLKCPTGSAWYSKAKECRWL